MVCAFTLLALGGCASQEVSMDTQQSKALSIRTVLIDQVRICSETIDYDPAKIKVAENKIAPNELKWRQCAYDAIHAYAKSHPELRDMYESLVAEDIAMTTAIQQENFTRTDRRQRIDRLLDQITTVEQQYSQHDLELTRQVFNGLR
jgi:hypothetical protein